MRNEHEYLAQSKRIYIYEIPHRLECVSCAIRANASRATQAMRHGHADVGRAEMKSVECIFYVQ